MKKGVVSRGSRACVGEVSAMLGNQFDEKGGVFYHTWRNEGRRGGHNNNCNCNVYDDVIVITWYSHVPHASVYWCPHHDI